MNSKKILVVFLLVTTVIIGLIAIYLIASLSSQPQDIDDDIPTATPTETLTPEPSITATPTQKAECGQSCTNNSCEDGNTCLVVGGFRRCVSDVCLNELGEPTQNANCTSSYCADVSITPSPTVTATPAPTQVSVLEVDISKKAIYQCSATVENRNVLIELSITNNGTEAEQLSVIDDLNNAFSADLVVAGSISNSGSVSNNTINWQKITVAPNSTLKLLYKVNLPSESNGQTLTNNVTVRNIDTLSITKATSYKVEFLPCTDLESDQIAIMIVGITLLFFGIAAFRLNWNQKIGNYLWTNGLENTYSGFRTVTSSVSNGFTTVKTTIAIFTDGLNKRISVWNKRRKMTEKERFEQDLVITDSDE